jgi:hypothetical protein
MYFGKHLNILETSKYVLKIVYITESGMSTPTSYGHGYNYQFLRNSHTLRATTPSTYHT